MLGSQEEEEIVGKFDAMRSGKEREEEVGRGVGAGI
jgi:hypothetical protein